jgi:aminoglycoside/choline kinase family phosphotransferase
LVKPSENEIIRLFESWSGTKVSSCTGLPSSGSYRQYYRITNADKSILAAFNPDEKENKAFISFSRHFHKLGLPVPEIYTADEEKKIYLLEDLGDITLFSWLSELRVEEGFTDEIISTYKKVITQLPRFQIIASEDLDYSVCYPRAMFDKQSMLWDLSYFKYYFLKLSQISFDEQKLEDDFQILANYLLDADCNYFLYRDFQSRNVLLKDHVPYFIDYQGGRKGALQYDIASLLYDAKADIPQEIRNVLLDFYIKTVSEYITIDEKKFKEFYYGYVLIRIMQALGAYGFRGFYEKKEHFLQSIPYALDNLKWLLANTSIPVKIPTLKKLLSDLTNSEKLYDLGKQEKGLSITINSFSYKNGIPTDTTGNGGGFVFDCRALHNPGRYDEFKQLTGKDKGVIEFLQKEPEMYEFMNHVYGLIDRTIENYQARKFAHLMVCFGCTGGQHRSVFCANMLYEHIHKKFKTNVKLNHRELKNSSV